MSDNRKIVIAELPLADGQVMELEVAYSKGGPNYWNGRQDPRGYYLYAQPLWISDNGIYTSRSFTVGTGVKLFLQDARAFSENALKVLASLPLTTTEARRLAERQLAKHGLKLAWSDHYGILARGQGWDLFAVNGNPANLQIQKLDDGDRFQSDAEAIDFVRGLDSWPAWVALQLHDESVRLANAPAAAAILIHEDGREEFVQPDNGVDLKLEQCYHLLDCSLVQQIYLADGRLMIIDEEGKSNSDNRRNEKATRLLKAAGGIPGDYIVGKALIVGDGVGTWTTFPIPYVAPVDETA